MDQTQQNKINNHNFNIYLEYKRFGSMLAGITVTRNKRFLFTNNTLQVIWTYS